MTQRRAVLFWLLLVPLSWWLTHALGYLVHEYAHSFSAWAVGYKADPLALNYGPLTLGNAAFLLDVDENVQYGPMFAAGKGYLASLVAVAGVLFGNGFLYVGARRFYSQAMQRRRDVLVLFALMLCLMNVGNFLCYVPVRTFATHADMATLEKGLHASPWWIITVLGIPFAIAIWHYFAKLLPDACGFFFGGNRIPQVALVTVELVHRVCLPIWGRRSARIWHDIALDIDLIGMRAVSCCGDSLLAAQARAREKIRSETEPGKRIFPICSMTPNARYSEARPTLPHARNQSVECPGAVLL